MAVSVPFLRLCGFTIGGWLMARAADVAANKLAAGASDREFLEAKLATAHFYATQVLPQVLALEQIVCSRERSGGGNRRRADLIEPFAEARMDRRNFLAMGGVAAVAGAGITAAHETHAHIPAGSSCHRASC